MAGWRGGWLTDSLGSLCTLAKAAQHPLIGPRTPSRYQIQCASRSSLRLPASQLDLRAPLRPFNESCLSPSSRAILSFGFRSSCAFYTRKLNSTLSYFILSVGKRSSTYIYEYRELTFQKLRQFPPAFFILIYLSSVSQCRRISNGRTCRSLHS